MKNHILTAARAFPSVPAGREHRDFEKFPFPPRLSLKALKERAACVALLLLGALVPSAQAQNWALGSAWYVTNTVAHLGNNNNNRGMAYSQASNQVFVATRNGANSAIDVFDGASGALLSGAGGVTGANTVVPDQIGVGDDGVLYAMPLNTSVSTGSPLQIWSWTNWTTAPTLAYSSTNSSDPVITSFAGKRIGDTMTMSGSGASTLILAAVGSFGGTNFVLFHTADGVNFTPTTVTVTPGLPATGGNFVGLAFYTNNTFLVQPGSGASAHNVYLISYPANFATQTSVIGTVLGGAGGLTANQTVFLNYSPAGQMLGMAQTSAGSQNTIGIFSLTNFPAAAAQLATTNYPTPNANGNATGGVALGGQGKTNYLYVLESNNGLQAYKINYTAGAVGPTITTQPAGVTGGFPPQTLTVTASGTAPLYYQWYSVSGGTTNAIAGATTNSYTITSPVTNSYFVIVTNGAATANSATSAVTPVSLLTPVSNPVVTSLWSLANGAAGYPWLTSDDATRGIAYDTNLNRVVVASRSGGTGLYILDGDSGASLGTLSTVGMYSGGTFVVDQVGVADDGVVYACNLSVSAGTFALTSWPALTNSATGSMAYGPGDPGLGSGDRWGDNMDVRGAGVDTQILLASKGTNVALFTTYDGVNFSPALIAITNVPAGFAGNGIAFGSGNTFWAKKYLGDLYQIAFDPVAGVGGVVFDYQNPSQVPSRLSGVGIDPAHNIFGGVNLADNHNDLQLFQLTGDSTAPVLFDQAFFQSANANGNDNAVVTLKYPCAYALDVNNGIVAIHYGVPATTPATITSAPVGATVYTNDPAFLFSVGAAGSLPIYYTWQYSTSSNLAAAVNIPGATNQTFTLNYPSVIASGWYDVIVKNIGGSQTSAPVLLTVIPPVASTVVTQLWQVAAGTRAYLDASSYSTRGLAFDTNTSTVLVADHNNIYVLSAADGSDQFTLNTLGLPPGTFAVDQIGVADDGVVYAGNLALTPNGDKFALTSWSSVSAGASLYPAYPGGDPGSGSNERWGDTLAVRGAGVNTEILIGSYSGTNVVLFTTADGFDFTPTLIAITNTPGPNGAGNAGFCGLGLAFGEGNTFWAKSSGYDLRQVAFDPATGLGGVIQDYTAGVQVDSSMDGLGVDVANNIIGGVVFGDVPNDLQLLLLSGNSNPPALFDQAFFATANANSQQNAVTTLKNGRGFSLDVNNGLVAVAYGVPGAPPVTITSVTFAAGSGATLVWDNCFNGHSYQVQYKNSLSDPAWISLGSPVSATGPTASITDPSANGAARFYRVQTQ